MNAIQLFLAELKAIFQKKTMIGAILVLFVPLIYVAILLSPDWGPYDNIDNLPVAVVNLDKGAINNGEPINVGADLVENLKEQRTLGWDFVTPEAAERGLKNMKYFMVIEIPENFSENITTVLDDEPKKAELNFIKNEGLHFMAAQVTDRAIDTIKNQLSTQITETYVNSLFSQLGGVSEGFQEAADGSGQIYDGTVQLKDGTTQILDALVGSSEDIERLAEGSEQLQAGTNEMLQSLTSKQGDIARLADGAQQLNAGTNELLSNLQGNMNDVSRLADGAKQVNDGTGLLLQTLQEKSSDIQKLADGGTALKNGVASLKGGAKQISDGLNSAKSGSSRLFDGLANRLTPGSVRLADGVKEAKEGVEETIESMTLLHAILVNTAERYPELKEDIFYNLALDQLSSSLAEADDKIAGFEQLVNGANELKDGLAPEGEFYQGLQSLDNGLAQLVEGQKQLSDGVDELHDGAIQLADGTQSVNEGWKELTANVKILHDGTTQISEGNASIAQGWRDLTDGARQLNDGATQIKDGNITVNEGWKQLTDGTAQINDGATQISEGNKTVASGWAELTDGVTQVDDGIGQLQEGANELTLGLTDGAEATSQLQPREENMAMFASPVELNGEVIHQFQYYRDSTVPYIMSLALFAGIVALSFIVPFSKTELTPSSSISWFTGKLLNLGVFTVIQALIITLFALLVLKVQVQSSFLFILFAIFVSLTFLMIILFLVSLAGNFGRFIALALIVLQLSITGSDLPIEMLPKFFRDLSVYLPLTYTIDGFSSAVTLGNFSNVWANAAVLLIYFALFGSAAFVVFFMKYRKNKHESELDIEQAT